DIQTYNIDPKMISEKITNKTVVIMVVHLYGKSCELDPIVDICRKHELRLIEDCAQSHGAKYKNRMTGTFGDFGAFSFYPTKNLGALGEAGAVTTGSGELAEKVHKLRNYGSTVQYRNEIVGTNQRLDEIQAAFLRIKLRHLEQINEHKRALANIYLDGLKENFVKPLVHPDFFDVYHIFCIRHPQRDRLRQYLLDNEIQTAVHYPTPPHKQSALKNMFAGQNFPISEDIHSTVLSLPLSYSHTVSDISHVVEVLNKFS
ncbi:DegT/DnrJ/EryC1/StrS family aminotransferase, partial [Candidatus Amesbacteria bacterium]|nr:DegT/DnrJ/EryC1/StrS family aminotransferase [Candidatus Amesbacteria bacterium]